MLMAWLSSRATSDASRRWGLFGRQNYQAIRYRDIQLVSSSKTHFLK
ncbi:hypothetical protein PS893_00539 [Pseudomonas fluorescens]|nr:hypothetical protein PS893_00539 [Pseudomonas fluorescens]